MRKSSSLLDHINCGLKPCGWLHTLHRVQLITKPSNTQTHTQYIHIPDFKNTFVCSAERSGFSALKKKFTVHYNNNFF